MVNAKGKGKAANKEVTQLCWWCCHSYDMKYQLPVKYIENTKTYQCIGQFCSFPCMKTYNYDSYANNVNKYNTNMLLELMFQESTSKEHILDCISYAPPRQCLKIFGGFMSIEEFRKDNQIYIVNLPPIETIHCDIEKHQTLVTHNKTDVLKKEGLNDVFGCESSSAPKVMNNPLKIRRDKSQPVTIEKVLGMFDNTR